MGNSMIINFFLFSIAATTEEKNKKQNENWQAMEMKNNAAYISTMLIENNATYYYGQARTQIPSEDDVAYSCSGDQNLISTKDNTTYVSTHLQVPITTDDNPACVITKRFK